MIRLLTPDRALDDVTVRYLKALEDSAFTGELRADYPTRLLAATDNSIYQVMPQAVVYPRADDDLNIIAELGSRREFDGISFTPRGGGTGTNGQALNRSIVVDTSKYLNHIIEFDEPRRTVTVQPGVVLDQLNAFLYEKGFFFPPTVSTSSSATLGGMTGTDASGKGSRSYGKVSDYIEKMDVVLSDGQSWTAAQISSDELQKVMDRDDIVGAIHTQACHSIADNRDLIAATFPKMNRGLTGYNLKQALDARGNFNLCYLLAGSEGSLCFAQQITFRVRPLPKFKALVAVRYAAFEDALAGVRLLLRSDPTAIEVIDDKILTMARKDVIWNKVDNMLGDEQDEPAAMGINFVEFVGDTQADITRRTEKLTALLSNAYGSQGQATGWRVAASAEQVAALWELRKKSVGLLGAMRGQRRAVPFVEDTAVPPENLAPYIIEFREILDRQGVDYGMFGHADVGCLHVRPTLDLTDPEDEARIRGISDEVAALTKKYGGLLWGEHGKGFRGEYSPQFFGPELYAELRKIKAAFDPHNRFNPGKIATPFSMPDEPLTSIDAVPLRGQHDRLIRQQWQVAYPKAIDCNGNGACFNWDALDPMCPSYKASRDRLQSPKGRAGMLREWVRLLSEAESASAPRALTNGQDFSHDVYRVMKTCLSCRACATACPIKVDIPEMKARFLEAYHQRYPRPLRDKLLANFETLAPFAAKFSRLTNQVQRTTLVKTVVRSVFGLIDLPELSTHSVNAQLSQRQAPRLDLNTMMTLDSETKQCSIVLIPDTFTSYYDAGIVIAHYDLLIKLGYRVYVAACRPNGKALHVLGYLHAFDALAKSNDDYLASIAATGLPMIGIEPAVSLMFQQDYAQRLTHRPSYHLQPMHEWLFRELRDKRVSMPDVRKRGGIFHLFTHCTEKASLPETAKQWAAIFDAFGQRIEIEKSGCCGMAGMFGHQTENRDMSKKLFDMSWRRQVISAGHERTLATGFSCRSQTKRFGGFRPRHPVQVLNELVG